MAITLHIEQRDGSSASVRSECLGEVSASEAATLFCIYFFKRLSERFDALWLRQQLGEELVDEAVDAALASLSAHTRDALLPRTTD